MAESFVLSGQDSLVLDGNIFNDFADASPVEVDFPNDIATVKIGKNGNAIFSLNEMGRQADMKVRVLRGTADDKFLQGRMSSQRLDFAGFTLLSGQFVKKLGDGASNIASDTYILGGGVFVKQIPGKMNVEGDTEQSVSMYSLKFAKAIRVIT